MITGEKLRKLYFAMDGEKIVSTKTLADNKLYSKDINILIQQGKIKRVKKGRYEVSSFDKIIGNDLNIIKEINRCKRYEQEKGYNIKPTIDDLQFIAEKYQAIHNGQILILLDPVDKKMRHIIHFIVKAYPDLSSFSIPSDNANMEYVVLKKHNPDNSCNFNAIIKKGNAAFNNNNIDEAITYYNDILTRGTTKSFIHAKLGLCYLKKHDYDNAIKYLTIATILSKEENKEYDYSNLIAQLKNQSNISIIEENINASDYDKSYNVDYFIRVAEFINENNISFTDACEKLNLSNEQICLTKLFFAKYYYCRGFYEQGDRFYKSYEKSIGKTVLTESLAEDIIKNKKFFKYRENEVNISLSLKLKP